MSQFNTGQQLGDRRWTLIGVDGQDDGDVERGGRQVEGGAPPGGLHRPRRHPTAPLTSLLCRQGGRQVAQPKVLRQERQGRHCLSHRYVPSSATLNDKTQNDMGQ